jgi:hypothetical protein
MDLKSEIEERDELIRYLREQLIKKTGQDVEVPYKWERFTGPAIAPRFMLPAESAAKTFTQAVKDLDLPMPAQEPKKGDPVLPPIQSPDYEKISLNNYSGRGVTKDALGNLIGGIKRLTKIKILELSKNGISDLMSPEIEEIFKVNRLIRVNLSNNDLGKGFLVKFGEVLKNGGNHLEWLE